MRGLRNELNKFDNTGARMLDSIYHMTFKLFFGVKTLGFAICMTLIESFSNVSC